MKTQARRVEPWNVILAALLAACIARLWLAPLRSSFWVDEMVTKFVVHFGRTHPSLAIAPQVAQSIYYVFPAAAERVFGSSEAVYRLPSILFMAVALWLIARLAVRLIHPQAAWFVVFACLGMRGINYEAGDARPYALGIASAAATVWMLVRWLDSGRILNGLLFAAFAALLWRVQLVYWPFYVVFFLYAIFRIARPRSSDRSPVTWLYGLAIFALAGVALLPVLISAFALFRQASAHVIVPPPSFRDLLRTLRFGLILECGMGAFLLGLFFRWHRNRTLVPATVALIAGWWLLDPLILFGFSRITGDSLFLDRYLSLALPGVALMATLAASRFLDEQFWKPAAAALGVGVLILLGQWSVWAPRHDNSDWRTAAQTINRLDLGPDTPIICPSPFIEARPPVWRPDYPLPSFLYCHLSAYPITGAICRFPFESPPEGTDYAAQLTDRTLINSKRFLIYGGDRAVRDWTRWFAARPELADWRNRQLGPFGNVSAVLFEH